MIVMLVGIGVTLSALVIQGVAVAVGNEAVVALLAKRLVGTDVWRNGAATLMLIMILLTGHLAQMAVWAIVYVAAGEFGTFALAFYHSAVNYTTLGYGDLIMTPSWRMLGPLEAADGMLMFGVSTAIIFALTLRLIQARFMDLKE